jgi:hypothetical protein
MPIEFSPKVPAENSPLRYASIASKATRRLDVSEDIKIEFDDGLESLGGGAVTEAVGQGVAPGGVFGLQGEQFGDSVVPSLWFGASANSPSFGVSSPEERAQRGVYQLTADGEAALRRWPDASVVHASNALALPDTLAFSQGEVSAA